ncbi:MAG: M23 family metallopeptidase [Ramlibacter sp.]
MLSASRCLALTALLLLGCGREEPATVVLDPATEQPRAQVAAPPPAPSSPPVAAQRPAPVVVDAPVLPAGPPAAAATGDGADLLAARSLLIPVEGVAAQALQDTYVQGRGERIHEAIDIMAAHGTRVVAVDDGRLVKLFNSVPGGLTAYQFDPQGNLAYYYAHLDRYAEGLKEGMTLRRGDLIGYVGSTGNAAAGAPHLHFAVFRLGPERQWWKGQPLNPYAALRKAGPLPLRTP